LGDLFPLALELDEISGRCLVQADLEWSLLENGPELFIAEDRDES